MVRMINSSYLLRSLFIFGIATLSLGCGGGGGGGGTNEDLAATVSLTVSPGSIDTGDRTTVEVFIDDLNEDGAAIKIRFPTGLTYIVGTSELEVAGDALDVAPTNNVSGDSNNFLVYYFRKSTFGDDNGILRFKLTGVAKVADGKIEVDADLDDPNISNQTEFSVSTPNFDAQSSDGITVNG